jgi:hypothetical protein
MVYEPPVVPVSVTALVVGVVAGIQMELFA